METAKEILGRFRYPDDTRTVLVIGLLDQAIEHHTALLLLIRSNLVGSGFALLRSIVEIMIRGMWINFCATDEEVNRFVGRDRIPLTVDGMLNAIGDKYHAQRFFQELKRRGWKSLCSYAHTGVLQIARRFTGHTVSPTYSDAEIWRATGTATTWTLFLLAEFLAFQKHAEGCSEVRALMRTFPPPNNPAHTASGAG